MAVEAEGILAAIAEAVEAERRAKQAESQSSKGEPITQLIVEQPRHARETAHKAAELFHTNRTYINEAAKLKETRPDAFEKVKTREA